MRISDWSSDVCSSDLASFTQLAAINYGKAVQLADKLAALKGVEALSGSFYNEFAVRLPKPATAVVEALAERKILGGVPAARLYPGHAALENAIGRSHV